MVKPVDEQTGSLESRSRQVFDEQVAALDAHTLSRLNRARQSALDAARTRHAIAPRWLIPAGSVAALALAAVLMIRMGGNADPAGPALDTHVDELEIIASSDELDFIQDVDFYDSLDAMDSADSEVT